MMPGAQTIVSDGAGGLTLQAVPTDGATKATALATLTQQALTAVQNNRDYLAIPTPTNAQAAAQIAALTHQTTRIIRYLLFVVDNQD